MPTYQITAPDGTQYRVTGEGTAEEALAHIQSQYGRQNPKSRDPSEYDPSSPEYQAKYGATSGMSGTQKFLAGAGKAMTDIARGAGQLVGAVSNEDIAASRAQDAPLMESGLAKAGNIAGGIATAVPAAFIPGANTVAGAGLVGAAYGALQPATSGKERLANTAIGGAAGSAGQYLGGKVAQFAQGLKQSRAAAAQTAEAQNAVRDAVLAEARQAGYVVPPSTVNPSTTNRLVEGLAGKAQTAQTASVRNQKITNRLVRQSLELANDAPLTKGTLNAVRSKAGTVYKAIEQTGEIIADGQYLDDLAEITNSVDQVAKDFPELNLSSNEQISTLVDGLLKDRFSARGAIEATKQLRKAASGNLSGMNAADPAKRALGYAQRDAAAAIEDQMIRHLDGIGKGELSQQFDAARRLIAKTYSVESALNESSGNVVATQLGAQLKKNKPLDGELQLIAKFARNFGDAAKEVKGSPGVSAVDAIIGGLGAATISPAMIALPAARIGARSAVLSGPFQRSMGTPTYAPGSLGTRALQLLEQAGQKAAIPSAVYAAQQ